MQSGNKHKIHALDTQESLVTPPESPDTPSIGVRRGGGSRWASPNADWTVLHDRSSDNPRALSLLEYSHRYRSDLLYKQRTCDRESPERASVHIGGGWIGVTGDPTYLHPHPYRIEVCDLHLYGPFYPDI